MDKSYITDVQNWLKWYNEWRPRMENMPLEQKARFLMRAQYGMMGLLAGLVDQVILVEEGEKARKQQILIPVGVRWHE